MTRVVVVGSSFAGMTAALELKAELGSDVEVVVVSEGEDFVFTPSLIWVPFGLRRREDIAFSLRRAFDRHGVRFVQRSVREVNRKDHVVVTDNGPLRYDVLVLATGVRPNWERVPGLGPRGHTESLFSYDDAQHAQVAWERFLLNPGSIVVGAAQGATDIAAAYEFALNVATQLEKRGPAGYAQQTFVTAEPYPGHLGVDGVGAASEKLDRLLRRHGIETLSNVEIAAAEKGRLILGDGRTLPFSFAMIAPPTMGDPMLRASGLPVDAAGHLLVDDMLRVAGDDDVFAAGSAVRLNFEDHDAPAFPKTGYHSERMGRLVAVNVAAHLAAKPLAAVGAGTFDGKYILDGGDDGLVMSSSGRSPGADEWVVPGFEAHWAKVAFERYFLATRSRGIVP